MARSVTYGDLVEGQRPNLPCISEEAMEVTTIINMTTICQDINFPEKLLEELECLDNITSCNKVSLLHHAPHTHTPLGGKLLAVQ